MSKRMRVSVKITASDGTKTERVLSLTEIIGYIHGIIRNRGVGMVITTSDGDTIEIKSARVEGGNHD